MPAGGVSRLDQAARLRLLRADLPGTDLRPVFSDFGADRPRRFGGATSTGVAAGPQGGDGNSISSFATGVRPSLAATAGAQPGSTIQRPFSPLVAGITPMTARLRPRLYGILVP